MALEASHIRFALDLKDTYNVSDIRKYISGTMYPDSRYVTGIDRRFTHPEDFLDYDFFTLDDFKKGWFVHVLCDKVQGEVRKGKFPEISELEKGQGTARWVAETALKILQDFDDVKKFDIGSCLEYLNYVENPNGESKEKLLESNGIIQRVYANPSGPSIDSYYEMWREFGIGDELVGQVKEKTEEFQKDGRVMNLVLQMYDEMLLRLERYGLKTTYNHIAKDWNEDHKNDTWWIPGTDMFTSFLKAGDGVLDVGCAGGLKSEYLTQKGFVVTGIDLSDTMIEIAKQRMPEGTFIVKDITVPLRIDTEFDGVFAQAVLLHIPKNDVRRVLKNVAKVLKPQGYFYVAVKKLRDGAKEEQRIKENDYGYEYERFFSFYTLEELNGYFQELGMNIVWSDVSLIGTTDWIQLIAQKQI